MKGPLVSSEIAALLGSISENVSFGSLIGDVLPSGSVTFLDWTVGSSGPLGSVSDSLAGAEATDVS